MISLFGKKETPDAALNNGGDESSPETPKGYTPPKGKKTPKRKDSEAVAARPYAPPKDNKEARQRAKELRRSEKVAENEGMRRGDERYLLARDKGPVRLLIRNIVDARRNAGTWFFLGTVVVFFGSLRIMPAEVRFATTFVWSFLVIVFLIDAVFLSMRIRKLVRRDFPDEKKLIRHSLYGVMRSVVFRRMRTPAPAVKVGDPVA